MGTHLTRSIRAFAVLALFALPAQSFADVTPAPVVAPSPAPPPVSTPVQTPTHTTTPPQQTTTPPKSTAPTAAQLAAQKKAAADAAKARAAADKKARIAAARAKAEAARKAALEAQRKHAALVAAQQKTAAERARLVSQQQHAEDTAQATFAKALQRDDAFRFAASAADSIGATAAIDAAPMDAAGAKVGAKAFATSPTNAPPIPIFAVILAAVALAGAAAYAVRSRAWRLVR
jgi:colicin import membrane protein